MVERYGTNPAVRFEWTGPEQARPLVAVAPEARDRVACRPELFDALKYGFDPKPRDELVAHLTETTDCDDAVARDRLAELVASNVVLPADRLPERRNWVEHGWDRSLEYHLATRDWSFETEKSTAGHSRPADQQSHSGHSPIDRQVVELPAPERVPDDPLNEVLLNRRTCRDFDGSAIGGQALSSILFHSLDPVRSAREGEPLSQPLAYFETGDFPLVVYPVVARSDDLERGVYRYLLDDHVLTPVEDWSDASAEDADDRLQNVVVDQPFIREGSVTLLIVADVENFRRRHPGGAALRHLYATVSVHSHRILLTANAFGFDVFQAAALKESVVDDLVGADGYDQSVLYFVTIGREDE